MSMNNTYELVGQDILKSVTGSLIDISKEEDEGPGHARWEFATEGEVDKDGDRFDVGSIGMERERGTVAKFQHNNEPAGTWTLHREGTRVYADVTFLDTTAGQDCRKYVAAMGDSAQFSFRAKVSEYYFADDVPGIAFKSVRAYETSPVYVGAGNDTKLVTIKSQEVINMDENEVQELEVKKEAQESAISQEAPDWAKELSKQMTEVMAELTKQPEPTALEIAKSNIEGLTDMEKKELGIPVFDGQADTKKYAQPVRPNRLGFIEKEGDLLFDMTKEFIAQPDFKDLWKEGAELSSYTSQVNGLDVMKADLVDVGRVYSRDRIRMEVTPTEYVLDMLPMLPVSGNSVQAPVMKQESGVPNMNEPNVENEITINVDTYTYPVMNLTFSHPVNRSALEDDPSLMAVEIMRLIKAGRQKLLAQSMGGAATIDFSTGAITASGQQLVGLVTNAPAQAVAENTDILSHASRGINAIVFKLREVCMPNMVQGHSDVNFKIWESLRRGFYQINMDGGGMAMPVGVAAHTNPWLAANTAIVGDFRDENFYLGIRRELNIRASEDREIEKDNVLFVATARVVAVTSNPNAFAALTATNNYRVEVPLVRETA